MWIKAVAVWLAIAVLAVINGTVRNSLIAPYLGEHSGHVISTVILCGVIFLVAWMANPWLNLGSARAAFAVGLLWILLTIAFEFLAGHFLFGHSWQRLIADYNLARGRVWVLVLLAILVAPIWAQRLRGSNQPE